MSKFLCLYLTEFGKWFLILAAILLFMNVVIWAVKKFFLQTPKKRRKKYAHNRVQ